MEAVGQGLDRVLLSQVSQFTESAIVTPQPLATTPVFDVGRHQEEATMSKIQLYPVDDASFAPEVGFMSSEARTSDHREFEMQPRSARMWARIQRFREFDDLVEAQIERSRVHWSEVVTSDSDGEARESNREVFGRLKKDPEYAQFFRSDFSHLKLGPKFAEGGQAEIFEAVVASETDATGKWMGGSDKYAVKVFKAGFALQDLQRQWPRGMLKSSAAAGFSVAGALRIEGGLVLDDDRFGFVLPRCWGDLRKLMDMRMQLYKTPFELPEALDICVQIATGMRYLHEHSIAHRDLKSSNILVNFRGKGKAYKVKVIDFRVSVSVADYECSVGTVGSGFWRAPEILQQLKNGIHRPRFTAKADVYSFGMLWYEILTGLMPFEGHPWSDYDLVLQGNRPSLLNIDAPWAKELICRCWQHDPSKRPTFHTLEAKLKQIQMFLALSSSFETVDRRRGRSGRNCIPWLIGVYSILSFILSTNYFLVSR